MNPIPKKYFLLLFFVSISYTVLVTQVNIHFIKKTNPANKESNARSLVHNSTVYSIDNYWYVNHVKNYLQYHKFTVDVKMPLYEVRRTPIYPLFYGLHYWLFGDENSFFFIRFSQTILLALAVLALFSGIYNFTGNKTIALLSALFYGLFPVFAMATSFTNAESISTELVCIFIFMLSLCYIHPGKKWIWFLTGISFAITALCRPSNVFLVFTCFFAILHFNLYNIKNILAKGSLFALGALVLFAPWTIRNYKVTNGDFVFLEKYYGDPMDYGMPHIQLRSWVACWINPCNYSVEDLSNKMLVSLTIERDTTKREEIIDSYVGNMPHRAFIGNSEEEVREAVAALYDYYKIKTSVPDKKLLAEYEKRAVEKSDRLKSNFIHKSVIDYYLITPLSFVQSIVFQSNSNSMAFLDNPDSNFIKVIFKAILYLITVAAYLSILAVLILQKKYSPFYWLAVLFIVANFTAIIYVLRYFEARYNLPLFPFLFGLLGITVFEISNILKRIFNHYYPATSDK
ncbi:MAG: glycosyltransferase family 39 protein [Sphingobacteriales bacterium]|jgi:4-amino-4-deoxy-L-arabinose transferase-like glycosyltransferase|nr:glycosyltransferase family 39 protein [Sphingobacteriales bacterium]